MQELTFTYELKDYSNSFNDILTIKEILLNELKKRILAYVIFSLMVSWFVTFLFGKIFLFITFIIAFLCIYSLELIQSYSTGKAKMQSRLKDYFKKVRIIISKDSLVMDNGNIQTTFKWNSIKHAYNRKRNFLLFIADCEAIIIPKRIFSSEEEIDNCWKYLQDCYNNAQNKN